MPTARSGAAAVAFDGRIVVIGGVGGPRTVERYDPKTKSWDRLPDLPLGLDHAMAATTDGRVDGGIFVFGGSAGGTASRRSFYWARDAERWVEISQMPEPRAAGAAIEVDREIFIVGGALNGEALSLTAWGFDLEDGGWDIGARIPTGRERLAAVRLGRKVCAIGGHEAAKDADAFECYDTDADTWEALPPLPAGRSALGAAAVGDRVIVAGGQQGTAPNKEVVVFDTTTRTWQRGPDLPTPRQDVAVVALDGIVYVVGGSIGPSGIPSKANEALTLR
jgi:N-acetylneuraminic acid mutarotase